jgi:tagatose 6-phosphate kinase
MILCVGTTPAVQRVMVFRHLEVNAVNRAAVTLDGAAGKSINVAKGLAILGAAPLATGFLGGDRGEFLHHELETRGILQEFVTVAAQTRQCTTVIDHATGTHTELVEEGTPVDPEDYETLLRIVHRRIGPCRAVVMSGTIPASGPDSLYRQIVMEARAAGKLTVVDARGVALHEALKAGPDVVKPNRPELAATVGHPIPDEPTLLNAMRELHAMGARNVVITAGQDPCMAFDGATFWRIAVPAVTVANPIGSGDAFTAAMTWALLRGDTLGEACRWGSAAGSANAITLMPGEFRLKDMELLAEKIKVEAL